ncbi:hypothetical protein M8J76_016886 [Diaphorina citri]|nr:hypothetical protein M8J76_016886 [Diaphorina citri]
MRSPVKKTWRKLSFPPFQKLKVLVNIQSDLGVNSLYSLHFVVLVVKDNHNHTLWITDETVVTGNSMFWYEIYVRPIRSSQIYFYIPRLLKHIQSAYVIKLPRPTRYRIESSR